MQKMMMTSIVLIAMACGRLTAPGVPEAFQTGASDLSKEPQIKPIITKPKGPVYEGETKDIGSIPGVLPSESDVEDLVSGDTNLPPMSDPIVMMPDPEMPTPTDPKPLPDPVLPDPKSYRTLTVTPSDSRGVWEGFGINLGPWAHAIGASEFQDTYADIFFSPKNTAFTNLVIPGLALNIVRYGVGGSGRPMDIADREEILPLDLAPEKDVDGYWIKNDSDLETSDSFDWTRDAQQRSFLSAAKDRGVKVFEFYSLAPMWWMTKGDTAFGGELESSGAAPFAKYLATVTAKARDDWKIPVSSIAPFFAPSSDRWTLGSSDMGTLIPAAVQGEVFQALQTELFEKGLDFTVGLSGSDEANAAKALATDEVLKELTADVYEKINVHTAENGKPSRDDTAKENLRVQAGVKRIWVSDHVTAESDGLSLALSIIEDIRTLRATAWIYGQGVDTMSQKSLLLGRMSGGDETAPRGKPQGISVKHYIFAHFSRFIRPGQQIIGGADDKSLLAYDPTNKKLSVIIVNGSDKEQDVDIDLSAFESFGHSISHVVSRGDGMKLWKAKTVGLLAKKIRVNVEAGSISSLEIPDVIRK